MTLDRQSILKKKTSRREMLKNAAGAAAGAAAILPAGTFRALVSAPRAPSECSGRLASRVVFTGRVSHVATKLQGHPSFEVG